MPLSEGRRGGGENGSGVMGERGCDGVWESQLLYSFKTNLHACDANHARDQDTRRRIRH